MIPRSKKTRLITRSRYSARISRGKKNAVVRVRAKIRRRSHIQRPTRWGQRVPSLRRWIGLSEDDANAIAEGAR
jgi:hypothetical protein